MSATLARRPPIRPHLAPPSRSRSSLTQLANNVAWSWNVTHASCPASRHAPGILRHYPVVLLQQAAPSSEPGVPRALRPCDAPAGFGNTVRTRGVRQTGPSWRTPDRPSRPSASDSARRPGALAGDHCSRPDLARRSSAPASGGIDSRSMADTSALPLPIDGERGAHLRQRRPDSDPDVHGPRRRGACARRPSARRAGARSRSAAWHAGPRGIHAARDQRARCGGGGSRRITFALTHRRSGCRPGLRWAENQTRRSPPSGGSRHESSACRGA